MRSVLRLGLALTAALVLVLTAAPMASAQGNEKTGRNIVVITGRAEVRPADAVDTVFIADGPATVDGTVRQKVIALNGDVLVRGTAQEEVVALDGHVVVNGTGHIVGDVVSRHRPVVEPGGRVDGKWQRWNAAAFRRGVSVGSKVVLWIAFTISTLILGLVLGLLAPRAATAVGAAARDNVGAVVGWGFLLTIGLPIAALLLMATLVGLPLGLGVLFALGLLYGVAYTTGAWVLGRRVAPGANPALAFLAGFAILRVIAIVPVLGGLAWLAAVVVGFGALAVAAHRARRPAMVTGPAPLPGAAG
jgi:hypothetical protein